MRRLITLLLCLLTSSGTYPGSASATLTVAETAPHASTRSAAQLVVTGLSPVELSREIPAVDPVWAAQAPVILAPTDRTVASHASQRHAGAIAASLWIIGTAGSTLAEPITSVTAGW